MGSRTITWGAARRFFERNGFEIRTGNRGGEKVVRAPAAPGKARIPVVIGHRYCITKTAQILPAYIAKFRRNLGVTHEHILNDEPWTTDLLPDETQPRA